jgi:acyl dehydratase
MIDPDKLLAWDFGEIEHRYTARDSILYALGVGLGRDPTDLRQLRFVYEEDLLALPTMPVVLASPGFWVKNPKSGVDWVRVLHGEQGVVLHRPVPAAGSLVGVTRITDILDKGTGKGALAYLERKLYDRATGDLVATLTATSVWRGDGGFSEVRRKAPLPHPLPEREPDARCDLTTLPQAALIYRLSGDDNPLHADPRVARSAGFERPILHGLATFGVAGHALLETECDYDPSRVLEMRARFSAPVYPGETLRTEIWRTDEGCSFRCRALGRDVVVLDNGFARLKRGSS